MEERCLKRINVSFESHHDQYSELKELQNIEIWNSKSKIVNEHIRSISKPLKFVTIVNPIHTPIWAIIDKPYNVFSSDEKTLTFFQDLVNYSDVQDKISAGAMLAQILDSLFILFYVEVDNDIPKVKCLLLEINHKRISSVLSNNVQLGTEHTSYFIDEVMTKKDEMIDTLLRQRSDQVKSVKMKKEESEKIAKEQQLRLVNIRKGFKNIIHREVKRKMVKATKSSQIEVAEICFKSMRFKFKDLEQLDLEEEQEIKQWLHVFLDVLGA